MTEDKRTLAAVKQAVYYRNYRRARDRALVRLAQEYQEEYLKMLSEERTKDEQQGKTWGSIGSTIIPPINSRIRSSEHTNKLSQAKRDVSKARNVGGEA